MAPLTRTVVTSLIAVAIAGCAVPKVSSDQTAHRECNLITKQMELRFDTEFYKRIMTTPCADKGCEGAAVAMVGIPTVTLVVSGSVVVVGNTLHWIEKEGSCDDSTTRNLVNHFTEELIGLGGILVNSVNNLSELFTANTTNASES